jgi:hypothetical protein
MKEGTRKERGKDRKKEHSRLLVAKFKLILNYSLVQCVVIYHYKGA